MKKKKSYGGLPLRIYSSFPHLLMQIVGYRAAQSWLNRAVITSYAYYTLRTLRCTTPYFTALTSRSRKHLALYICYNTVQCIRILNIPNQKNIKHYKAGSRCQHSFVDKRGSSRSVEYHSLVTHN